MSQTFLIPVIGFCLLVAGPAVADPLRGVGDPTRPPALAAPEVEAAPAAAPAPVTAVRATWSVGARRFALIDDEVVEVGKTVGESTVVRIEDGVVTLRGPTGEQTVVSLTSQIERKLIVTTPPAVRTAASTASAPKSRSKSERKQ